MLRRSVVAGLFTFSILSVPACDTGPAPVAATPPPPARPAPVVRAAPPALHLGEPISARDVALADLAKDPTSFADRPFTTHGTVTAVCQEMGCWMELKDSTTSAHLRMHGHSFFVPKTASGHEARVQATLVPSGAKSACAEAECAPKDMAMLQLDATGVELN